LTGIVTSNAVVQQCKLRLYVGSLGTNPTHSVAIDRLQDNTWSESTVTWNNLNNTVAASGVSFTMDNPSDVLKWVEVDILDLLLDKNEPILTLRLVNLGIGEAGVVRFTSRDSKCYGP